MGEHKRKTEIDFPNTTSMERHQLAIEKKFGGNPIINIFWIVKNDGSKRIGHPRKGYPYSRKINTPGAFGKGKYLKKICKHERTVFNAGLICSRCFKILEK
jgi:hypothetical protein